MFSRRKSRNYSLESYTGVSPNVGNSQGVNSNALAAAAAIGQSVSGSRSNSMSSYSPHYAQSYQGNNLPYISEEDGRLSRSNSRTTVRAHRASYNPPLRNKVSFSETNSDHTPETQPRMVKKYVPSPHGLVAIEVPESSISRSGSITRSGSMTGRIPRSVSLTSLSAGSRQKARNGSIRGSRGEFDRRMPRLVEESVEGESKGVQEEKMEMEKMEMEKMEMEKMVRMENEKKEMEKKEKEKVQQIQNIQDTPEEVKEDEIKDNKIENSLPKEEPTDKPLKETELESPSDSHSISTEEEEKFQESQNNLEKIVSSTSSNYADPELGIVNHYKEASSKDLLTEQSDSSVMEKPSTATSINSSVDSSRKNMAQQMRSTIPSLNVPDSQKPISKRKSALKVSPSTSQNAYNTLSTAENTRLNAQRSTLSLQKTYSPKREVMSSQQSLPLRDSQYISSPVKPPVKPSVKPPAQPPVKTPTRSGSKTQTKTYPKNYPKSNARVKAEELYKKANSPANINVGPPDNSDLPVPPRRSSFEKSSANESPSSAFRRTTMRPDAGAGAGAGGAILTPQSQQLQNRQLPAPSQPRFQSRFADSDSDDEIVHRPRAASVENAPQLSGLQQRFYSDHLENKEKKQKKPRFGKLKKLFKRDKREKE